MKSEVGRLKGDLELNQKEQKELQDKRKTETKTAKNLEKTLKSLMARHSQH